MGLSHPACYACTVHNFAFFIPFLRLSNVFFPIHTIHPPATSPIVSPLRPRNRTIALPGGGNMHLQLARLYQQFQRCLDLIIGHFA